MSAKCSNSPSLRLEIVSSRIYRLMHSGFCLLAAASLWRLAQRGYPVTALLLSPVSVWCCWRLACQPLVGAVISWRRGEWQLQQGTVVRTVGLARSHTVLPWLIYLAWTGSADTPGGSVFLFPDSAQAGQLRRLRVRLVLER